MDAAEEVDEGLFPSIFHKKVFIISKEKKIEKSSYKFKI